MDDIWDNSAWDDLQRSFPNNNSGSKILFTSCLVDLMEIGMQIAERCKGVPLAIVSIAGILANENTLTRWTQVVERASSYIVSNPEQYMDTLTKLQQLTSSLETLLPLSRGFPRRPWNSCEEADLVVGR
ncbi:hypothetical protein LguiA_022027 [Lonicera macranthoides]